jgi:tetratricopeptide (TPR) repeat protein
VPDHRDVLLYVAIAQRYLDRISDALNTLEILERHHPRFSRLYEERGRCFVDMKQAPQAIEAFERAVSINYALPGSWRMLDGLYRMTGQTDSAAMAANRAAKLQNLPPEVLVAAGCSRMAIWRPPSHGCVPIS